MNEYLGEVRTVKQSQCIVFQIQLLGNITLI